MQYRSAVKQGARKLHGLRHGYAKQRFETLADYRAGMQISAELGMGGMKLRRFTWSVSGGYILYELDQ